MTIKRTEHTGSSVDEGDVLDISGNPVGRGRLTRVNYRRVFDAGTHQEPHAEVRGMPQGRAHIAFNKLAGRVAAIHAVRTNANMTIHLDNGETVRFQVASDTSGEINITKVE